MIIKTKIIKVLVIRNEAGRSLMSVRDCDQRGKSNLSIHNVKSDEKRLKATSKKLQLKAKLERKK